MTSHPPIAFVLGAPRSGTTLFRVMLAGHPGLWSPPEMVLAPFETMPERRAVLEQRFWEKGGLNRALMDLLGLDVEGARAAAAELEPLTVPQVYDFLFERLHGRVLVDKCPHLSVMPEALHRLVARYPEARFLWIVRHPGAVTRSLQNMPMAEVMLQGYPVPPEEVWAHANQNIADFLATIPQDRWTMLRYEDLIASPRPVLERVCATLGVPFDEATLHPYEGDRMRDGPRGARAIGDPNMAGHGAIKPELADRWLEGYDPRRATPATRELAVKLGYDLETMALPPIAHLSDAITALFQTATELERGIQLPMDLDATEGRRFLLRMVSASVDTFVENGDPDHPTFEHAEGPTRKMFADNPDADYNRAPIRVDGDQVYRVWGRIPAGTLYTGVLLYGKGGRVSQRLVDEELGADADGRFELRVSRNPQPGVWMRADGDETAIFVRQYYTDRGHQASVDLHIEPLHEVPPAGPLSTRALTRQVGLADRMLRRVWERTIETWKMASTMALNRFVGVPGDGLFPTPDNRYRICWYRFGADQLMFVRGKLPDARYSSFTLYNAWMESLDYTRHRVALNHAQIQADEQGNFELCVAHRDHGHPNTILTVGHQAGYLLLRVLLPEGELPELSIQVLYEREWVRPGV